MPVPRDAKLKDAKDTWGLQGMSEAHQIKIFSGEILTFLKPASPGAWLASASNSGLRAPTPCNLPVQAEIFISGIIRGQVQPFIEGGFVQGKWWRQLRAITLR